MKITFYDNNGEVGTPAENTNYVSLKVIGDGIQRKTAEGWKSVEKIVAEHELAQEPLTLDLNGKAESLQSRVEVTKYTHVGDPPSEDARWAPAASASWRFLSEYVTRLEFKGPEHDGHQGKWDFTPELDPGLRLKIVLKRKI